MFQTHRPIASVDIDNTLVNFSRVLHEELLKESKDVPPPEMWGAWDFYYDYMTREQFYSAVRRGQNRLPEQEPMYLSDVFLERLGNSFYIVITSHREPHQHQVVTSWLDKYKMKYNEVYISHDKTTIFPHINLVVDDSPEILKAASAFGLPAIGLQYPWNIKAKNTLTGVFLFESYTSMMEHGWFLKSG